MRISADIEEKKKRRKRKNWLDLAIRPVDSPGQTGQIKQIAGRAGQLKIDDSDTTQHLLSI